MGFNSGFKGLNCWCVTWPVGFKRLNRENQCFKQIRRWKSSSIYVLKDGVPNSLALIIWFQFPPLSRDTGVQIVAVGCCFKQCGAARQQCALCCNIFLHVLQRQGAGGGGHFANWRVGLQLRAVDTHWYTKLLFRNFSWLNNTLKEIKKVVNTLPDCC